MKKLKKTQMINSHLALFLLVLVLAAVFTWKKAYKAAPLSQSEVIVADEIEGKNDLTQAAEELDSMNVDGDIDPDLTEVYSEAQMMK